MKLKQGAPAPSECDLYAVDRDALFSYHRLSESFLRKIMGLYTSAHYKNSPNDLQMLSDAPAHAVFVLLSPTAETDAVDGEGEDDGLPDVLAVVQVALEGRVSRKVVEAQLARGHRFAGDLIPWTVSQQFGDSNFAHLSGARIIRVAVAPVVQGMGYGTRAIELLYRYYNGDVVSLVPRNGENDGEDEDEGDDEAPSEINEDDKSDDGAPKKGLRAERLKPQKKLPTLLLPIAEVRAPRLNWLGTSFGLTTGLHKFWSRAGMSLLYIPLKRR
jgi:N-acetyltransferase 10